MPKHGKVNTIEIKCPECQRIFTLDVGKKGITKEKYKIPWHRKGNEKGEYGKNNDFCTVENVYVDYSPS